MRATLTHSASRKSFTSRVHKDDEFLSPRTESAPWLHSSPGSRTASKVFNMRARSLSPADVMARSQSPSCLSPITRGDGPPDEKVKRLRGAGEAIGRRGRASLGIPWRQIPSHDRTGMIKETGDPFGSPESKKKEAGSQSKKTAQCSGKLAGSQGMKELLGSPTSEKRVTSPCMRRSMSMDSSSADFHSFHHLSVCRNLFGGDSEEAPKPKPSRRSLGPASPTKDSCPFFRQDSVSKGPASVEYGVAEKVVEARRDYRAFHDNPELERMALEVPRLRKSMSSLCMVSPLTPPQTLSKESLTRSSNVVHSIRPPRTSVTQRRWK